MPKRYGDKIITRDPIGGTEEGAETAKRQQFRLTWFWIGDFPEMYDWWVSFQDAWMYVSDALGNATGKG